MKYAWMLVILILAGCGEEFEKRMQSQQTENKNQVVLDSICGIAVPFKLKNHKYIKFRFSGDTESVIHDPDCECKAR